MERILITKIQIGFGFQINAGTDVFARAFSKPEAAATEELLLDENRFAATWLKF